MKNVKCKKIVSIIMAFLYFALIVNETIYAKSGDAFLPLKSNELYALSACLMDADSGRVLYDKNADEVRAMASTTKIMTLIVALEYANEDDIVTVSPYAASMPDVQLNIMAGEQYRLGDLYYAMMLESFNDVAVTIAEYIGECYALNQDDRTANTDIKARSYDDSKKYVHTFAKLMNEKAKELGCENTYFITPNGLDAEDENGKHSTTAKELAVIASYAIKNERFNDIIGTRQYSFCEVNGTRNCSAYNKDAFLNQMNGAFGIKTGFTGNAGYCFVGALKSDGRTFISVVLGSGWPSNRTYKWKDTRKLMEYGINNFFPRTVFSTIEDYKDVRVKDGMEESTSTCIKGDLSLILCEADDVRVVYELEDYIEAPVSAGDVVGKAIIYVNGQRMGSFPITAAAAVERANYMWYLKRLLNVTL
jgi:D-alanyl-D-alanine carboxypeptidase (penicillin-binding protein 5/6)